MAPKRGSGRRTLDSEMNSLQERVRLGFQQEQEDGRRNDALQYLHDHPSILDTGDNDRFLEHFSGLAPLQQNWEETCDSDSTQPPDPSQAPPSQAPPSHSPTPPDTGSSSRRGRGKNKNSAVGNLGPGEKMSIHFNADGRPYCGNSVHWARHIGQVIRDPTVLPHTLRVWADLSQAQLDRLWQVITDPFVASPSHIDTYRQVGLAQGNKIWNRWRVLLKDQYITPHGGDNRAVRENPPPEFTSTDWSQLLDRHYFTPEFQKRSERNAQNRARVTYLSHAGSINFSQVEERMERTTGRRPDLAELFLASHSKKSRSEDGTTRLVSSDEVQSKATELEETINANAHMSRFEVVESVFGPQSHGRVIGLGSGITPTTFRTDLRGSSSGSSQHQRGDSQFREENEKLRQEVSDLRAEMDRRYEDIETRIKARMDEEWEARIQARMDEEIHRKMEAMFGQFRPPPPPPPTA